MYYGYDKTYQRDGMTWNRGFLGPILLKKKKIIASLQKPTQGWENNERRISAGHFLIELGP